MHCSIVALLCSIACTVTMLYSFNIAVLYFSNAALILLHYCSVFLLKYSTVEVLHCFYNIVIIACCVVAAAGACCTDSLLQSKLHFTVAVFYCFMLDCSSLVLIHYFIITVLHCIAVLRCFDMALLYCLTFSI